MELGIRLKEAREAKNLSLDDIQKITKIQTRYLRAIEEGDFNIMPGNFYIRAFIKEYAAAVDLDPEQLMEEFKEELPTSTNDSTVNYSRVQRSRKESSSSSKSPAILSYLPTIIVVILIVGIVFVFWKFTQDPSLFDGDTNQPGQMEEDNDAKDEVRLPEDNKDTEQDNENSDTDEPSGADESEPEPEPEPEPESETSLKLIEYKNAESTYELVNPLEEITIQLETDYQNWLEIENGKGKSFYYDMFVEDNSPHELDMTGEEEIFLKFGNPKNLTITINGKILELSDEIDPSAVQKVWIKVISDTE